MRRALQSSILTHVLTMTKANRGANAVLTQPIISTVDPMETHGYWNSFALAFKYGSETSNLDVDGLIR